MSIKATLWSSRTRLNSRSWDLALWWFLTCDDGMEIRVDGKERALEVATLLGLEVVDESVRPEPVVVDAPVYDLD